MGSCSAIRGLRTNPAPRWGWMQPWHLGVTAKLSHCHLGMVVGYPAARTLQDGTAEIQLWEAGAEGENPGQHPHSLYWKW